MFKKIFIAAGLIMVFTGCAATVPMAKPEKDAQAKKLARFKSGYH